MRIAEGRAVLTELLAFIADIMGLRSLIFIFNGGLPTISDMEEDRIRCGWPTV